MNNQEAQANSYPKRLQRFEKNARGLASSQPGLMNTFWKFHADAVGAGALDTKTKELIALAISIYARCDDCIAHHVDDALNAGATKEEVVDALGVAILMGGGVGVVYATHALEAVEQFLEKES